MTKGIRAGLAAIVITVMLAGCSSGADPSGFTESLAFKGHTKQSARELQVRLDRLHERFGLTPGREADENTEWLLLELSEGWVSVDKMLDCLEGKLDEGGKDPEITAYAAKCAEEIQSEYEESFG